MNLLNIRPYPVGKQTTLFYIDEHYKVQPFTLTKELVENGSVKIPRLPYNDADYELFIKDGQVFTDYFDGVIVTYTEKETGEVHEPFACNFLAWELSAIFPKLSKILKAKVKRENKERYPLIRFMDAKTSEVLTEFPYENYYKENFALNEMGKYIEQGHPDILVQTFDKEANEWVSFELRRLNYWKALDDAKAQVVEEVARWKEDL